MALDRFTQSKNVLHAEDILTSKTGRVQFLLHINPVNNYHTAVEADTVLHAIIQSSIGHESVAGEP
jgi:hypothetical protein